MKQKNICDECKQPIKDDHGHKLINWDDQRVPACCLCYGSLVGCEVGLEVEDLAFSEVFA